MTAEVRTDIASAQRFALLAALLDHDTPPWRAGEVPPLGHWLMFPPTARQSALGPDGHPARDDAALPRRMWAGSRITFYRPIPFGAKVTQEIRELSAVDKTGRSGPMRFVTLGKRLSVDGVLAVEEEQDLVYREAAVPGEAVATPTPIPPATPPEVTRQVIMGPVALFRFSALTHNAHRIHYDRAYATEVEGYPGLVVHGPLIATLLMDHFLRARPGARVASFEFRAKRPLFDGARFKLGLTGTRTGADLIALAPDGGVAVESQVAVAGPSLIAKV